MTFAPDLLDDIRARLPVSEVVRRRVVLRKAGREWRGMSPFNAERTPSFYVNDQKGFWHDFSSGRHGDVFAFLVETEGTSFPDAVATCAGLVGVALPERRRPNCQAPPDHDREAGEAAWQAKRAKREADEAAERVRQIAKAAYLWSTRQSIVEGSAP